MKLLNELITLRRDDDQPDTAETDMAYAADDMHDAEQPAEQTGPCPHCQCDPCECEHEMEEPQHEEDAAVENPYEEGTPEHEAWLAGFEAGLDSEAGEEGENGEQEPMPDEMGGAEEVEPMPDEMGGAEEEEQHSRAYTQGKRHYGQGTVKDNPYPKDTKRFHQWQKGWLDACYFRGEEDNEVSNPHAPDTSEHREWEAKRRSRIIRKKAAFRAGVLFPRPGAKSIGVPRIRVGDEDNEVSNPYLDIRAREPHDPDSMYQSIVDQLQRRRRAMNVNPENRISRPDWKPEEDEEDVPQSELYAVKGVKQVAVEDDDWYEMALTDDTVQQFSAPPRGSRLAYQLHAPFGSYRSGAVEAEIWRAPNGNHYYREILTGDNDDQWFLVVPKMLRALLPWSGEDEEYVRHTEEEESNEFGSGVGMYSQGGNAEQGAPATSEQPEQSQGDAGDATDANFNNGQQQPGEDKPENEDDPALDQMADKASEDPNHQGLIRKVPNAHLVYKRQTDEGNYEELWVYNSGALKDSIETRKAILAGTDIPVGKTQSPDGMQTYQIWTSGNVEMVLIKGLQN